VKVKGSVPNHAIYVLTLEVRQGQVLGMARKLRLQYPGAIYHGASLMMGAAGYAAGSVREWLE